MAVTVNGVTFETQDGTSRNDTLVGTAARDWLQGLDGDDTLTGNEGGDFLDGGTGVDTMVGGVGDDEYVIDNVGDVVVENAGEGFDTIYTSFATFSLEGYAHFEGLTGGDGNQQLTGNSASNFIDGGLGGDTMIGGPGNDRYFVENPNDVVVESAGQGRDRIYTTLPTFSLEQLPQVEELVGDAGDQMLFGNSGNNTMIPWLGSDTLFGGAGDDIYRIDSLNHSVVELAGEGNDRVITNVDFSLGAGSAVELLMTTSTSSTYAISLTGNELAQTIVGNAGVNVLTGDGGDDKLSGWGGNDRLEGGDGLDRLLGGDGADQLYGGAGNDKLWGDAGNDRLWGDAGNDRLWGNAGDDAMAGGQGDDIYYVDSSADSVSESAGEGVDQVIATADFVLQSGVEVEKLVAASRSATDSLDLTGNEFAQTLYGNAGSNVLSGGGARDYLYAFDGNDTLIGGGGRDILFGGAGQDQFVFGDTFETDRIRDFSAIDDTIVLDRGLFSAFASAGAMPETAFHVGAAAHDADDRIIYDNTTGNIYYDADGDGAGAKILFAQVSAGTGLWSGDFAIVG